VNSFTHNVAGLAELCVLLQREFSSLGGEMSVIDLPAFGTIDSRGEAVENKLGQALQVRKRPEAGVKIFLGIHYDTVYPPEHPMQRVAVDGDTMRGPGVTDAKGGIAVLLTALRAFEQSDVAEKIGWEILLNPDEEIGSPGSAEIFREVAKRNQVGLVFEPAREDGSLVSSRKGSGNFVLVVHGKSAHAGRDYQAGRSAIYAAADLVARIEQAQKQLANVTINCGKIEGGQALNVVPELAIARFNVRVLTAEDCAAVERLFRNAVFEVQQRDGITISSHGGFTAPPKVLDERSGRLLEGIIACGRKLGLTLSHQASGGVSDGNKLAAAGLPVIDSMGPIGGKIHSSEEYLLVPSLVERAKLTALVLWEIASGKLRV
jgi:glutamate carboxypeptidase